MISIIHPSRGRPEKSFLTIDKWKSMAFDSNFEVKVSLDKSDQLAIKYYGAYDKFNHPIHRISIIENDNRSCVDAINNAAKIAVGDIFIVVSDDTDCFPGWDTALLKELEGKSDYLLKTDDGIQDYIVTMTVMDRTYFQRDGYIYHPDFFHQFADTYLTCVADIRGRLIKSNLKFPHLHPGHSGGKLRGDSLNARNDASWGQGQDVFLKLMKQFTPEERSRIKDPGMRNWLRNKGVA